MKWFADTTESPTGQPGFVERTQAKRYVAVFLAGLLFFSLLFAAIGKWQDLIDLQLHRLEGSVTQGEFEDYIAFYAAGKLILEGRGDRLYDVEVITAKELEAMDGEGDGIIDLAYFNPPFVAVLFSPLALLPVDVVGVVLLIVNYLLLVVAVLILLRLLRIRGPFNTLVFFLAATSLQSVFWLLAQGQFSMLLLLGFLGFYTLERQEKPYLSGLALSLLLFKPQMALLPLIVLVANRRWESLLSFSAVAMPLILLSLAVSGPEILWRYPSFLLESTGWDSELGITVEHMYGWNGWLAVAFNNRSAVHLALTTVATLATVGAVLYSFRGPWRPTAPRFALSVGVMLTGAILVNPHVYMQDMVLVGLVAVMGFLGWPNSQQRKPLWLTVAALIWIAQLLTYRIQALYDLNIQTPLLLAIFIVLLWGARTPTRTVSKERESSERLLPTVNHSATA